MRVSLFLLALAAPAAALDGREKLDMIRTCYAQIRSEAAYEAGWVDAGDGAYFYRLAAGAGPLAVSRCSVLAGEGESCAEVSEGDATEAAARAFLTDLSEGPHYAAARAAGASCRYILSRTSRARREAAAARRAEAERLARLRADIQAVVEEGRRQRREWCEWHACPELAPAPPSGPSCERSRMRPAMANRCSSNSPFAVCYDGFGCPSGPDS